jgi:site-specific DNA-methyltransferase (adenine-specific)
MEYSKLGKVFTHGNITLINGDCMELLAGLEPNEFDLAIVDPPYGIGIGTSGGSVGKYGSKHEKKQWDIEAPITEYFEQLRRVSKNQIIWGANHFISKISVDSSHWIVWDKVQPAPTFAQAELAWSSFKGGAKIYKLPFNMDHNKIHPTQKPVKLYQWLLANYAKPADTILDTHLGSGSSAIAAHYAGHKFVGIELDPDYYEAAVKRFIHETAQQSLI